MSKRMLVAGNWKMNLGRHEADLLANKVARGAEALNLEQVEVALFPPFPWLVPVRDALVGSRVLLGAQHCHQRAAGAFTGEVAAPMLVPLCDLILAGHSERRHVFGESDELVGEKVVAILSAGARAVLCVGETLPERESGRADSVVTRQLNAALAGVSSASLANVIVAYEPVWAIGTGVAATAADAQTMCAAIRAWLRARYGADGGAVQVLYGGSVTPDNAAELFAQADVDGGLVGGASLKAESFLAIVAAGVAARGR